MSPKKRVREVFRDAVFARDGHKCVICLDPAVYAHHIVNRKEFPDGGYILDNGVSLCSKHYLAAEKGDISILELREAMEGDKDAKEV